LPNGGCVWPAGRTIRVKWQIIVSELPWIVDAVQLAEEFAAKEVELEGLMITIGVCGLDK
jgi:hypothetical protein